MIQNGNKRIQNGHKITQNVHKFRTKCIIYFVLHLFTFCVEFGLCVHFLHVFARYVCPLIRIDDAFGECSLSLFCFVSLTGGVTLSLLTFRMTFRIHVSDSVLD